MTTLADDGAGGGVVVLGDGVGVNVGETVTLGEGVGVAESVGHGVGVAEVVSAGMAGIDAPAVDREVTKPPEIAVAAVSAVIRAMRRQSPVRTRRVHRETAARVRRFDQNRPDEGQGVLDVS